jgi:hypothetical protein
MARKAMLPGAPEKHNDLEPIVSFDAQGLGAMVVTHEHSERIVQHPGMIDYSRRQHRTSLLLSPA